MKKCTLLLLLAFIGLTAFSQIQQIKIGSFVVKTQLPSKIDNWVNVPGALLLVAQKVPTVRVEGVHLVLQIKSGGSVICGSNASNGLQVDNFTTRTFSAQELIGLLAGCKELKDGTYSLCAQFFNIDRVAISNEMCKDFTVESQKDIDYAPPTLINPDNGKKYTLEEFQRPVTFRWTPLVPKPKEPVTYRLRVWQLMQGQNGTAAMKANQPIVDKEVKEITQATVTNILTGPCKPPYLCDFIWNIQAVNRDGKPMGKNDGTSEPYSFSVMGNYGITVQNLVVECPKGNSYNFTIDVGNPNNSVAIFDKLEVVVVNGVTITPINITPTVPAIGTTIPNNGTINVAAAFTYATPITTVCLKAYIKEQSNPLLNTASSYTCDTLHCQCDPCKTLGVSLKDDKLTTVAGSGQIILSGIVSGLNPSAIKKITMELIYDNIEQTGDTNCVKCAENKEWGNFIKPASAYFSGYNPGILNGVNFGREWTWLTTVQKECGGTNGGGTTNPDHPGAKCATCGTMAASANEAQMEQSKLIDPGKVIGTGPVIVIDPHIPFPRENSFSLPIAIPPGSTLKCCGDKIKICIRFTVWDFCCHACDVVKCYEIERKAQ